MQKGVDKLKTIVYNKHINFIFRQNHDNYSLHLASWIWPSARCKMSFINILNNIVYLLWFNIEYLP
jgi:hypothetical protein